MKQLLAVAIGGSVGAICRHLVSVVCSRYHFALGTLIVNIVGCFLIGLLITMKTNGSHRWDDLTHSALTVGFLGALTTFSTFGFQTSQFFNTGQHGFGLLNIAGNMLLGLLAVYGGIEAGRWLS